MANMKFIILKIVLVVSIFYIQHINTHRIVIHYTYTSIILIRHHYFL